MAALSELSCPATFIWLARARSPQQAIAIGLSKAIPQPVQLQLDL
jgi:hypothetical protein